jgi:hypothetical protein
MRRSFIVAAVAALLLVVPLVPAGATPPLAVDLEVLTPLPPEGEPWEGSFTATGPAVDAGLICPTGNTFGLLLKRVGFQSHWDWMNDQAVVRWTCADGSGEFYMKLQVRHDWKGSNYNWVIVGGTGAYERLHGSGQGFGTLVVGDPEVLVLDSYFGKAHVD